MALVEGWWAPAQSIGCRRLGLKHSIRLGRKQLPLLGARVETIVARWNLSIISRIWLDDCFNVVRAGFSFGLWPPGGLWDDLRFPVGVQSQPPGGTESSGDVTAPNTFACVTGRCFSVVLFHTAVDFVIAEEFHLHLLLFYLLLLLLLLLLLQGYKFDWADLGMKNGVNRISNALNLNITYR